MGKQNQPFWRSKGLEEMSRDEWESLCDGCAQCCLIKLEDEDTGELFHTKITCKLLDIGACRCQDYDNRHAQVPDCIPFTPESIPELSWLPKTCAYRLIGEGRDLYWWHPLVSGDPNTVHEAGVSVRSFAISESGIPKARFDRHVIREPLRRRYK